MSKLSIILHGISVLAGFIGIGFTHSAVSRFNAEKLVIEQTQTQITAKDSELKELVKEMSSSLLRDKNRLQDESEEALEISDRNQKNSEILLELKEQITAMEKSISDSDAARLSMEEDQKSLVLELQQTQQRILELRKSIPVVQNKIDQVIEDREELIQDIDGSADKMSSFTSITNFLKEHYSQTTSALWKYSRERPWLEPGEVLSLKLKELDVSSGLVALPRGSFDGIREKMLFAVHSKQREICKIRIKQTFRNHALAEIIPLIGSPLELLDLENVDLVAL